MRKMHRIGAFAMCEVCSKEEFKTDDPVRKERKRYIEWLNVYKTEY